MGAFEALLDLLAAPTSTGEITLEGSAFSHGWKPFTQTEAVAALTLMIDVAVETRHSSTRCNREVSGGQPSWPRRGYHCCKYSALGRWRSRAFTAYVREVGEGAESVPAALAHPG